LFSLDFLDIFYPSSYLNKFIEIIYFIMIFLLLKKVEIFILLINFDRICVLIPPVIRHNPLSVGLNLEVLDLATDTLPVAHPPMTTSTIAISSCSHPKANVNYQCPRQSATMHLSPVPQHPASSLFLCSAAGPVVHGRSIGNVADP
jgi:hypothetical protein